MLASAYQPYLYLPRPVSRRHPMDVGRRAKQFAPFAALRGLDEIIRQHTNYVSRLCVIKESRTPVQKNG